jgi:hypothetical protein
MPRVFEIEVHEPIVDEVNVMLAIEEARGFELQLFGSAYECLEARTAK